jgi:chondroitin AC lyase
MENPSYFVDNPTDSSVAHIMGLINDDGMFADVDYSDSSITDWQPRLHCNRITVLSCAYVDPKSRWYNDHSLYSKIIKGIKAWYLIHPVSDNWWWNVINTQQQIGSTLILMRFGKEKVSSELETLLISRMKEEGGNPADYTAANRSDVALHCFFRGLLTMNEELVQESVNYIYEPICYTTGEGFQIDNSFYQHSDQCYLGGYADVLIRGVLPTAIATQNTRYSISDEKLEIMSKYMLGTFAGIIRGSGMFFNCIGRILSRKDALSNPEYWTTNLYSRIAILDTEHEEEYKAIIERTNGVKGADYNIKPFHTHFYRSDYTLHVRPKYSFGLRNVSKRTVRCESGNGENLLGYFVSDGSYNLSRTGDEYYNIMPLWDWYKVPGTTTPKIPTIPFFNGIPQDEQGRGRADFMGGVSDSIYGVTAVKYYDPTRQVNTGATKSWFFFDDEIVCLGSGINSDYHCTTSVNQCYGHEFLLKSLTGEEKIMSIPYESSRNDVSYILHDSIGYLFPTYADVIISNKLKEGPWTTVNRSETSDIERGQVFSLAVDHKNSDTYQFIIIPGVDEKDMEYYVERGEIEILQNDENIQAVHHRGLNLWGIVFYKAGRFANLSLEVVVDRPCILLLKEIGCDVVCHASDPLYSKACINISIKSGNIVFNGVADFNSVQEEQAGMTIDVKLLGNETSLLKIINYEDNYYLPKTIEKNRPFRLTNDCAKSLMLGIYYPNGVLYNQKRVDAYKDCSFTISTPGLYILQINNGLKTATTKFIVK